MLINILEEYEPNEQENEELRQELGLGPREVRAGQRGHADGSDQLTNKV